MRRFFVLGPAFAIVVMTACTPYDPDLPQSPFLCGTTAPQCPEGFACDPNGACVSSTGPADGSGGSGSHDGSGSGSGSGTCTMPFSGVLATWSLASEPGDQDSTPAASAANGVTAGSISRSPALTPSSGTGSISSSGWPTNAQLDPASFYTIALTPPSGCALDVTSVAIDLKSSGTGPTAASIGTSADVFAQEAATSTTAPVTVTLSASVTSQLELRIFGFSATATTGTMRVENDLTVTGTLH